MRTHLAILVAVIAAFASQCSRSSADDWWYSSSGGSFHSSSNWYYGTTPSSGDEARFYLSQNGTISLSQSVNTAAVRVGYTFNDYGFGRSTARFDLNGNTWASNESLTLGWGDYYSQSYYNSYGSYNTPGPSGFLTIVDGTLQTAGGVSMMGDSTLKVTDGGRLVGSGTSGLSIGTSSTASRTLIFEVDGIGSSATFGGGMGSTTFGINQAYINVRNGGVLSLGQTGAIGAAYVQIDGVGSMISFGSESTPGDVSFAFNRDSSLTVSDGGVLRTLNGGVVALNSDSNTETTAVLNNGIIDASGGITKGSRSSLTGHGVLIGNSSGLTIASPNGAVDTSYDMNIGGRRADIFSNGTATLRSDVSLSGGGQLNSAQTVHLIGGEFSQAASGGVTTIGGNLLIDNSLATISGGNVNVSGEVRVGGSNGSSTLSHAGGTITAGNDVVVGSSLPGVYSNTGGHLTTTGNGELIVGDASGWYGTVNQDGGAINVHTVKLANIAGAQATYDLTAGTLNTRSHLYVGTSDSATYNQSGGEVTVGGQFRVNHGSTATIDNGTLHSVDSLRVGTSAGLSNMTQNGGLVKTDEYVAIGSGGDGSYTMTGGTLEAKAVDRGLYVGTEAGSTGSMNQSGGNVDVGSVVVGHNNAQSGEYTLSDGTIAVRDRLVVGNHSLGTFNQSGGIVNAGGAPVTVGNVANADGSAYSMSGGTLNADSLVVGNFGDGTFSQDAGQVNAGSVTVAQQSGSTSSYSLTGGTLTADTLSFGSGTGSFNLNGGTLNVGTLNDAGGTFTVSSGVLNAGTATLASLHMTEGLLDLGTLNGDLNMTGGMLAPGDSPGTTTINGNYSLSGGTLEMELAGLMQGTEYDFLDINGTWTITGGDLQVSLLGGFMPLAGNSFDLFDFDSLTGSFDNIFLPTLGSGLSWNTSALYSTGTLSVNSSAAVPEPSSWALLALIAGAGVWRSRRKQSGA